ncbi:ring-cleaving dioxygenase MhqE [Salimicrobium salexigens]|uniref:Glyoxalase family protein n=1 Tax=Salimicrobium salexigens TaxID=908941 RepID=A0ABY1KTY9_9BACI|nr:ring-cleaving dioxygenase [Salimicrobium salexigens]SIS75672.1 glyoxalase family protein [Salimicrobium salexigens]
MTDGLLGIHHVTAITDDAARNYKFFTEVLGMRLVKKTVNQDDIQTYHTFFADDVGSPGTDVTFFDFPNIPKGRRGTNSISRIGLRVPDDAALKYYQDRFEEFGVKNDGIQELFEKKVLPFEEADGQRFQLFSDENDNGVAPGTPWKNGPVPEEKAVYGLGPIEITVSYFDDFKKLLGDVYKMKPIREEEDVTLLEVGEGGNGGQVILRKDETSPARQGYGEVHHVSFRVKDHDTLKQWEEKYNELGMGHSGNVNRFYFEALYTRIGDILVELSTDGPGFMGDEPYETLGESLSLPPFLESQREQIEAKVRPFNTKRS